MEYCSRICYNIPMLNTTNEVKTMNNRTIKNNRVNHFTKYVNITKSVISFFNSWTFVISLFILSSVGFGIFLSYKDFQNKNNQSNQELVITDTKFRTSISDKDIKECKLIKYYLNRINDLNTSYYDLCTMMRLRGMTCDNLNLKIKPHIKSYNELLVYSIRKTQIYQEIKIIVYKLIEIDIDRYSVLNSKSYSRDYPIDPGVIKKLLNNEI